MSFGRLYDSVVALETDRVFGMVESLAGSLATAELPVLHLTSPVPSSHVNAISENRQQARPTLSQGRLVLVYCPEQRGREHEEPKA